MTETYRTIEARGEAAVSVAGSEFYAIAEPVETVADAEALHASAREADPDATHHVLAYRVRADPVRSYADGDGEPSGSAGKPALGVLEGEDLLDVAVVIVRHFGGTELGVGGLVKAYSRATREAIADAGLTTRRPHDRLTITVAYDDSGDVRAILESEAVEFDAEYAERVTFEVRVPVTDRPALEDRIASATSGRATVE
ncbi:MAG: IMPACT family protein [Halococcoides sp.]